MRPLVRPLQVLGLALLVALGAGSVVSADSSSLRQSGYPTGPTGPTGTATATPTATATRTPTATPTATPGRRPAIRLTLAKKSATRGKGVKARITFDRAGRVTVEARKGKRLSRRAINFKRAGRKTRKLGLKKLEPAQLPAQVTVRARGRDTEGNRSKLVRKRVKIRR